MKKFCEDTYISLINEALVNGYIISNFRNYYKSAKMRKPILLLRHDCDLSLDNALKLALLEQKLNISSTYFILLYNDFYNPFSPSGRKIIKQIYSLGHEIGIHWDSRNYEENKNNSFTRDIKLLEEIIKDKIHSGSQHEPVQSRRMIAPFILKNEAYRDFKDIPYISDSSMQWRSITPWNLVSRKISFQFLAHPFWWTTKGATRKSKFKKLIVYEKNNLNKKINNYARETENFLIKRVELDKKFNGKRSLIL